MALSNYEIMRNQMRGEFVKYDQDRMIQKFQLAQDAHYSGMAFPAYHMNKQHWYTLLLDDTQSDETAMELIQKTMHW